MARQNTPRFYGAVSGEPVIAKDINGNNVRGIMRISVLRNNRASGEKVPKEETVWDHPLILSVDEEMVNIMAKLKLNDIVEIEGQYVTRKVTKNVKCAVCGHINRIEGSLCFVMPTFIGKRNSKDLSEFEARSEIQANRSISNSIIIIGNLCNDVNYYKNGNIESSVYQIGTERKRIVTADEPVNRADFPIVRSYGRNARMDKTCIHKGTLVAIDGYLRSKSFTRKSICDACGDEFEWEDSTMEIVPYVIEYLADFIDPETAAAMQEEAEKAALEANKRSLFN